MLNKTILIKLIPVYGFVVSEVRNYFVVIYNGTIKIKIIFYYNATVSAIDTNQNCHSASDTCDDLQFSSKLFRILSCLSQQGKYF